MGTHDLIIRGGTLIDPGAGIHAAMDVAVRDGKIAAVGESLDAADADEVVDATGMLVTPGLVDLHVHLFSTGSAFGIDADTYCLAQGTTTAVDAGTAGAFNYRAFEREIAEASTRVFALLNISGIGIPHDGELYNAAWADPERAAAVIEAHRDRIVGIKIRMSPGVVGPNLAHAFAMARQAARAADAPLVVHPNAAEMPMAEILAQLRAGDVITHCFNTSAQSVVDADGKVRPEVIDARRRGVRFDVGHGVHSFSFETAERALDQGFAPDTISSDLFALAVDGPVYNLPHVLSKFLMLGMGLDDVIARATIKPAQLLPSTETIGTLRAGAAADITVMQRRSGRFEFVDGPKTRRVGDTELVAVTTVRAGRIVAAAAKPD